MSRNQGKGFQTQNESATQLAKDATTQWQSSIEASNNNNTDGGLSINTTEVKKPGAVIISKPDTPKFLTDREDKTNATPKMQ